MKIPVLSLTFLFFESTPREVLHVLDLDEASASISTVHVMHYSHDHFLSKLMKHYNLVLQ